MNDPLYNEFYDPSNDFLDEPRAFCYEISSQLIEKAKQDYGEFWYESRLTIEGILLLLYTWNFAAPITKKLNFENITHLMGKTKEQLLFLERFNINNADENAWDVIKNIFDQFRLLFGQTGASKALSLLNPGLFVMWDTKIRKRLNRRLIMGIGNGESGDAYVTFLIGIQGIIRDYRIEDKIPHNSIVAKKIDEYHYVRIIMNKKVKKLERQSDIPILSSKKIILLSNLRGRSIYEKVIPTVCNLRNTLEKLTIINGDVNLLKPWEKRSYEAYLLDKIKPILLASKKENWKGIMRNHILMEDPSELGASCIDIYLVAYVAENYGPGKKRFFQFIKKEGISKNDNSAQAIWQVGKGDGVFLDLLEPDGRIKDMKFFKDWTEGLNR